MKKDISIIVINFGNTKEYTRKCLQTLLPACKKLKSEIIVIDNISTDGTAEMIKKDFKEVIYIRKDKPYGFGANNNFGLQKATARYVLFLNSDTELLDDNILKEMVDYMDKNPKVAVSSSALLNSDRKTLQASGGAFPDLLRVFMWMTFVDDLPFVDRLIVPFHPMHDISPFGSNVKYYKTSHQQDWVTGAFYLARKEVLDKLNGFDEDYDAYVEEVDLSYRIKRLGYQIMYLPKWKIVHHGGVSYGSERSFIYELKNIKLFYSKHYPKIHGFILNLILKLGIFLRIIVFGVVRPEVAKIYRKALKEI